MYSSSAVGVVLADGALEHLGQDADVGEREVEALGAGWRHGVRGVPGQQHPAVRMGSWTKLRNGSTAFAVIGPSWRVYPLTPTRGCSSAQIRSSLQSSASSSGSHWKYIRCTVGVRWLIRAKPGSEWL